MAAAASCHHKDVMGQEQLDAMASRLTTKPSTGEALKSNTKRHLYRTLHLARLTDRYRAVSHAGMTTVCPPQQPPAKLTYHLVNTSQAGWSTCPSRAFPSSLQVSCTPMHPHKHRDWKYSLGSPVGVDTEDEHD
ncbi:hypothetical protein Q8A73_016148 [Channa argus]|nr:hypothetical protein Q8A73_016148 [Channa argus]